VPAQEARVVVADLLLDRREWDRFLGRLDGLTDTMSCFAGLRPAAGAAETPHRH
jgi:hypothetical protein